MILRTRLIILLVVAMIATAILAISGGLRKIEDGLRWVFLPAARTMATVGGAAAVPLRHVQDAATLAAQNQELSARLGTVVVDYVRLRALEEENRSLRAAVGFLQDAGFDHVAAHVIARSTDPQSATVLIDRGSNDGLELGMAVIVGDGIYVGKITSLSERVSTVTLVSDSRSRVAASVAGAHRLLGVVEGKGNYVARLTLVPQVEPLKRDDLIVTAGSEEKIPANLSIGIVNDVDGKPTDPFKSASLEPLERSDRIESVFVLRSAALRPKGQKGARP